MKKYYIFIAFISVTFLFCQCSHEPVETNTSKVWLHRANSIEKAKYYQYDYPGLEIDVHFDNLFKAFVIKHDANAEAKCTLEQWLDQVDNIQNLGIWFDFKNLNDENRDNACQCLVKLRKKYHLKGKLYVESGSYNNLKVFKENGFNVSYYIPDFNPETADSATCQKHAATIQKAINSGVTAISGYDYQYKFMRRNFPNQTLLLWTIRTDTEYYPILTAKVDADSLVDILLIPNLEKDFN